MELHNRHPWTKHAAHRKPLFSVLAWCPHYIQYFILCLILNGELKVGCFMLELSIFFLAANQRLRVHKLRRQHTHMHRNILISKLVPTHLAWVALQFAPSAYFAVHEKQKKRPHPVFFFGKQRTHCFWACVIFFLLLVLFCYFIKLHTHCFNLSEPIKYSQFKKSKRINLHYK